MKRFTLLIMGIAIAASGTAALAQQELKGTLSIIDRINHTVSIRPTPADAGAGAGANSSANAPSANSSNTPAVNPSPAASPSANAPAAKNQAAKAPEPEETFKVQQGVSLDTVHVGDQVTVAVTDAGGTRTITKIQK